MTDWKKRFCELYPIYKPEQAAVAIAQEAAAERAESLAQRYEDEARVIDRPRTVSLPQSDIGRACGLRAAAEIARSTITKKQSREERLEAALREIVGMHDAPKLSGCQAALGIAMRALEERGS